MSNKKLAALIILDGFGLREEAYGNAVKQANKPNFDRYWNTYATNQLRASGEAVGLPKGQMGNSEVGHLNIGAGRVVYQTLSRVNISIEDQDFYEKAAFVKSMERARDNHQALHLFGLLSDGGVHSHIDHLFALLKLASDMKLKDVYIHAFLDGRDVAPQTAQRYIKQTEDKMKELGVGQIATISGRYYAMDRDKRWERVKKVYDSLVYGTGPSYSKPIDVIKASYNNGAYDEFVVPAIIKDSANEPVATVKSGDSIIFYNFRPDRAIQLSQAFTDKEFNNFDRGNSIPSDLDFVTLTNFSETVDGFVAYEPLNLHETLGEVLSNNDISQLRVAETEKYPHVTFFMNGGREGKFPGEERLLINSPNVATYDLKPEMSAYQVTDALLTELEKETHEAIILNFANPDMVGHSGKLKETIQAIEVIDECLGKIVDKIIDLGGYAIITADHGNADEVIDVDGNPMTAHTTNPVPIIVTKDNIKLRDDGKLADIAPTFLDLLHVEQPEEMTGESLIIKGK